MKNKKKIASLAICMALVCTFLFPVGWDLSVNAADDLPVRPSTNKNYADLYTGVSLGAYWDASYYSVSYAPLAFTAYVGTDHMVFSGTSLPLNFVAEMDIVTPEAAAANPEYRIVIGDKTKNLQVLLGAETSSIYEGYSSGGPGMLESAPIASGTAPARTKGSAQHVVVQKKDNMLSVWVDGQSLYTNIDATGICSGFGFYLNSNPTWVGGDDHTIGVTLNNVDIYACEEENVAPTMPTGNRNYADITGWHDRDGGANYTGYMSYADGTITATAATSNPTYLITEKSIEYGVDYAMEMDLTIPSAAAEGSDFRLLLGSANTAGNVYAVGLYLYKERIDVYQIANNSETVKLATSNNYTRKAGTAQHIAVRLNSDDMLSVWVDGQILTWDNDEKIELAVTTHGTQFGISLNQMTGVSKDTPLTVTNIKRYYLSSLKEETDTVLASIPPVTYDNYATEDITEAVAAAEAALAEWLDANEGNSTTALKNYALLEEAKEQIAYWKEHAAEAEALRQVSECIAAIPVITPENCEAELSGSIKTAEEAVAALLEEYPNYHAEDIVDYNKIAVSKKIAENGGVAENLLYYVTGVQPYPVQSPPCQ